MSDTDDDRIPLKEYAPELRDLPGLIDGAHERAADVAQLVSEAIRDGDWLVHLANSEMHYRVHELLRRKVKANAPLSFALGNYAALFVKRFAIPAVAGAVLHRLYLIL